MRPKEDDIDKYIDFADNDYKELLGSSFVQNILKPLIILIGSFVSAKAAYYLTMASKSFTQSYVVPQIGTTFNLREKYGDYVVVTNVTDKLGTEFAKAFLLKGHSLVVIVRMNDPNFAKIRPELEVCKTKGGGEIVVLTKDVTKGDLEIYESIQNQLWNAPYKNKLGILVNNAGLQNNQKGNFLSYSEQYVLDLAHRNVVDFLMITKAVLTLMHHNEKGLIVNISMPESCRSVLLDSGFPQTMRQFIDEFNRIMKRELWRCERIQIQAIHPGCICTGEECCPTSMNPSPDIFVKSAMNTLGRTDTSAGYPYHSLRNLAKYFIPNFLKELFLDYLARRQSQEDDSSSGYTPLAGKNVFNRPETVISK